MRVNSHLYFNALPLFPTARALSYLWAILLPACEQRPMSAKYLHTSSFPYTPNNLSFRTFWVSCKDCYSVWGTNAIVQLSYSGNRMRAKRNLTFPIRYSAYVARACVSALAARNQTNRLFETIIARSLYTMVLRGYLYISLQSSLLYAGLQECSTRVKSKIKGRSRQTR